MYRQNLILNFDNKVEPLFVSRRDNRISFDTFFNSFNVYLAKKYLDSHILTIAVGYDESISFEIVYENKNESFILYKSNSANHNYKVDLDKLPIDGIVYLSFNTDDLSKIRSIYYETDSTEISIKPSFLITTYNRQDFLIPNLRLLKTIEDYFYKVIIVDNGNNLVIDRHEFSDKKYIVIPNKNIGGTGGFTRGMIEAKKLGSSHIFIMDDDITLIPEVIKKSLSLAANLSPAHQNDWIGFSMLPLDKPLRQYELGTKWNGIKMFLNHRNYDLSNKKKLFKNQINTKYNYSAWWSLIMPISVLEKYGYPFPFFIKFDDIEYGLRRENEEIILSNGLGVWHEDFDKKYNPYLEYYLLRNALITNDLHCRGALFLCLMRFLLKSVKSYFKGQFIEMKLMRIAVNDYLKGAKYFIDLDIENRNKEIREIASHKPNIFIAILVNPFLTIGYFFKLMFKHSNSKNTYTANKDYLTSIEYWGKIFS